MTFKFTQLLFLTDRDIVYFNILRRKYYWWVCRRGWFVSADKQFL